jgi:hypothetical protein
MLLMAALAPAALFAQDPAAPTPPKPPEEPKLSFSTPAGLLLIQIKPDQTGVFEELLTKLRDGLAKATDAGLKEQFGNFKVYKATEQMGTNALYVVLADPVAGPKGEYEFFQVLQKVMTPEELRAPETQEMFKKFSAAFAAPYNKLNLTPVK